MRVRILALCGLALMVLLLVPSTGWAADTYKMRVFRFPDPADPGDPDFRYKAYVDWRLDGECICNPACPCNFYWGYIPLDPMDPFAAVEPMELGVSSGNLISPYPDGPDIRWGRPSLEVATHPDHRYNRWLAYYLMGPAFGGPETCGGGGSLGDMDTDADGIPEMRGSGPGDACDVIGRYPPGMPEQKCAPEWPGTGKVDQNPYSPTFGSTLKIERDFRCKVILLNLSAHW
jgi:hypothetical protein